MTRRVCFFSSTVGMKFIMGLSGIIWVGFVMAHMLGNLLLFVGPEAYNEYSHALTSGKIIYLVEGALIFSLLSHLIMGVRLTIGNQKSKGVRYHAKARGEKKASLASRTMAFHGSVILFFIFYHLITFKFGTYYETNLNGVVIRDIHRLVVEVFSEPLYVIGYILCLFLLMAHLSHGVGSLFRTFGLNSRAHESKVKIIGFIYSLIVGGGFIIQPIYVYLNN